MDVHFWYAFCDVALPLYVAILDQSILYRIPELSHTGVRSTNRLAMHEMHLHVMVRFVKQKIVHKNEE